MAVNVGLWISVHLCPGYDEETKLKKSKLESFPKWHKVK
jgi:hypothetical protein